MLEFSDGPTVANGEGVKVGCWMMPWLGWQTYYQLIVTAICRSWGSIFAHHIFHFKFFAIGYGKSRMFLTFLTVELFFWCVFKNKLLKELTIFLFFPSLFVQLNNGFRFYFYFVCLFISYKCRTSQLVRQSQYKFSNLKTIF